MQISWLGLEGKSVIVTGAASGIGKAVAQEFLNCGANVAVCDLNPQTPEFEINENSGKMIYLHTNVCDAQNVKETVKRVCEEFGTVDVIVNNAGINIPSLLDEEKFFILHSDKSYMENVDYMIDKLYDLSYVDEGFKERIHTRESKSTMVFDEYIALPHAINKETDKIVFSIGVFSDDKNHETDSKLKVIFLLAIPDIEEKDDDILVKIYDEIIAISKDKQVVENIAKVKNYRELLLYFIKQDNVFN